MDLKDWVIHHIKQKDSIRRDSSVIKVEDSCITCEHKEGIAKYYCASNLKLELLRAVPESETVYFVCECNEHNFKLLSDHWDLLKLKQALTVIFLNPSLAEKWIIKPFVHAKIADPATLRQGLRTMYDTCIGNAK
jgi:hypothetical protein